MTARDKEAMC